MIRTSELPDAQPALFTICWMTEARLGVRWAAPASPTTVHAVGAQGTEAMVRGRDVTLLAEVVKVAALSAASPWMLTDVAEEPVWSAVNWTQAFTIDAPFGIATPVKR